MHLLLVPRSTVGGWHPDSPRALCPVANTIDADFPLLALLRAVFQRHAALLVTDNALCLMSGFLSGI